MNSSNVMMDLSEEEMLELWKTRLRLLPARRDCVIEREDGIDIDAVLLLDIKEWYSRLLAGGSVDWLPVEDLRDDVVAEVDVEGVVTAMLPSACVRPVEWMLEGWEHSVVEFYRAGSYKAMCQNNIYLRGDEVCPVAVLYDNSIKLYSIVPGDDVTVSMARCVVRPVDGRYRFSEAALSTMQDFLSK